MKHNPGLRNNHFQLAINDFQKANQIFSALELESELLNESNNLIYYVYSLSTLGLCQKALGLPDNSFFKEAVLSFELSIKHLLNIEKNKSKEEKSKEEKSTEDIKTSLGSAYLNLGESHILHGSYKKTYEAADYKAAQAALELAEKYPLTPDQLALRYHFLGMCLLKLNQADDAIFYLSKLYEDVKDHNEGMKMDAIFGLGLCAGIKTQFKDQGGLDKLFRAYAFYQYDPKGDNGLLGTPKGVAKMWLNHLSLPIPKEMPWQLQRLVSMIGFKPQEDAEESRNVLKIF